MSFSTRWNLIKPDIGAAGAGHSWGVSAKGAFDLDQPHSWGSVFAELVSFMGLFRERLIQHRFRVVPPRS